MGRHRKKVEAKTRPDNVVNPRRIIAGDVASPRTISYAVQANGTEPAKVFYDALSDHEKDRFDTLFLTMVQQGRISNAEKFRPKVGEAKCSEGGSVKRYPIAEFKVHLGTGSRILACLDGNQYVLTNGFRKGSPLPVETRKAERIFCDDLSGRARASEGKGA